MRNIYTILRQTVMVLSVFSMVVSAGAIAQNNNWQQLQNAQKAQQAGKPVAAGTPQAIANRTADRMVFSNGVAKLTRPLTPSEMKRGFTGKVTEDGRTLVKTSSGRTVMYHEASNIFAVRGADGVPRTMFRPDPAQHGYKTNMDYFNAQ